MYLVLSEPGTVIQIDSLIFFIIAFSVENRSKNKQKKAMVSERNTYWELNFLEFLYKFNADFGCMFARFTKSLHPAAT